MKLTKFFSIAMMMIGGLLNFYLFFTIVGASSDQRLFVNIEMIRVNAGFAPMFISGTILMVAGLLSLTISETFKKT